ncbi:elongator complex protein 5 isoform X2 [Populus alba x Populus x berolinensis]|nr:elongator complex protein 5 isoform X2 [Populus alba x Populus x berolinensis]
MCGALRDGSLEGEQAPALTIRDTTASPFGFHVLSQLSSFILASKSQSRCIVIVAFSRSPFFYILDCYWDPLGWKDQLMMSGNFTDVSYEASLSLSCVCRNVKDLDKLYSLILELGKGLFGQGKDCFSVAIDLISSIFWLLHSDLHEVKVTSLLEYLSYVVVSVEPLHQTANGQRRDLENLSFLEQNFGKGKLQVRFKR